MTTDSDGLPSHLPELPWCQRQRRESRRCREAAPPVLALCDEMMLEPKVVPRAAAQWARGTRWQQARVDTVGGAAPPLRASHRMARPRPSTPLQLAADAPLNSERPDKGSRGAFNGLDMNQYGRRNTSNTDLKET